MPHLRFTGGIVLLAVLLTACGLSDAGASDGPVASNPTVLDFVDPARVPGLSTETITREDSRIHLGYPVLADAPELNAALRESLSSVAARPGVAEVNTDWRLVTATDDVVGVRLSTGSATAHGWVKELRTVWYDRTARRVLPSAALVSRPEELAALVAPRLREQGVATAPRTFPSLSFNRRGDLVAEFGDGQLAPVRRGRVAVAVPLREATPLLSAFGRRAWAAVVVPVADVPSAPPDPTPAAVPARPAASPTSPPGPRRPAAERRAGDAVAERRAARTPPAPADCAKEVCVALTFEDGPGPETGRLLDLLAAHGTRATFFTIGQSAAAQPHLLRRMRDEGHAIGIHTWSHRDLTLLSMSRITDQIIRARHAVGSITGAPPRLLRTPYGVLDENVRTVARRLDLPIVGWSTDTGDLTDDDPKRIAKRALAGAENGAIIRMHDTRKAAVDAVPYILDELTERGVRLVTVPELYGSRPMQGGQVHDSGELPPPNPHGRLLP